MKRRVITTFAFLSLLVNPRLIFNQVDYSPQLVKIYASTAQERTQIANLGIAIEEVYSDYIIGTATKREISLIKAKRFKTETISLGAFLDFPEKDKAYHNYQEQIDLFKDLKERYPEIINIRSIGKSIEGREIWLVKISDYPDEEEGEPGVVFLGTHHAREHLSTEVPIFLIKHLVENYGKSELITSLVNSREIYIIPLVNPDGSEYDIANSNYRWWRKNHRPNEDGSFGVDLNRNYGYQWGGEGASSYPGSDIYRGKEAFSEPETQAVRDFLKTRPNIKCLLSYHSYSELILYPWGYTYDKIANERDRGVFEKIAQRMAKMTGYTAQKISDLYLASGATDDWAYHDLGLFSLTIELYPKSYTGGGFYPGGGIIEKVCLDNLPPALFLIEIAADPYQVLEEENFILDPFSVSARQPLISPWPSSLSLQLPQNP